MIEHEDAELSLTPQTELLSLNRSSLYYVPRPPSPQELYINPAGSKPAIARVCPRVLPAPLDT